MAWGNQAKFLTDHVVKGQQVAVSGRLTARSYDDQQTGQTVYVTEVQVREVTLVEWKETTATNATVTNQAPTKQLGEAVAATPEPLDELPDNLGPTSDAFGYTQPFEAPNGGMQR
ncbi:single-stranded DNA-binding protein [Limosilactobacillus reuteri]|uniref:single-stranded DNA-binding protein n=1 Tax=Limosilactobacillus reuteri TaxID=1598 RepID=UPI001E5DD0D7|nr:single-stranded DNA-binding protein [Limosilactobacillus reuteri]MCC4500322.1 single-stranded DNA-binding protein [Limosilactobacillus reuteri]MCC4500647.1 single-stranded DNA-binding protein [Limosilactobacillus reuteri]